MRPRAMPRESRNGSTVSAAGAQEPRRRHEATADDGQVLEPLGRVVQVRSEEEGERLAAERRGVERAEQPIEVERPSAAPDPAPGAAARRGRPERREPDPPRDSRPRSQEARGTPGSPALAGRRCVERRRSRRGGSGTPAIGLGRRPGNRPASSSARSVTTTTSASTTIRRLIFDWPTRRSRNVIGISTTRAPRRDRPERHLDLEDVAAGVDAVERDRRQRRGAPGLEPAGEVPRAEAQDAPSEDAAAARDDPPAEAPVDDAAALRVARADDEVGAFRRRSGAIRDGSAAGSCDQSASIWTTTSAPPARATPKPSR